MPRKARIDSAGALQHITVRGIARKRIFYDDGDRENFVARLTAILLVSIARCYAWVLIFNYQHLLFRTGKIPISTFMRRLLSGYVLAFNHRHHRHGPLFQNHYESILCLQDPYLLELVRFEFEFTPWMSLR